VRNHARIAFRSQNPAEGAANNAFMATGRGRRAILCRIESWKDGIFSVLNWQRWETKLHSTKRDGVPSSLGQARCWARMGRCPLPRKIQPRRRHQQRRRKEGCRMQLSKSHEASGKGGPWHKGTWGNDL
jgi:hypothetical protein